MSSSQHGFRKELDGRDQAIVHETSPAVERAAAAARARAANRGDEFVKLADWVFVLLEDDEGKPAIIATRAGAALSAVREGLMNGAGSEVPAPPDRMLFTAARQLSLSHRGDPTLTTDFLLLAVVYADAEFRQAVDRLGLVAEDLSRLLRTKEGVEESPAILQPVNPKRAPWTRGEETSAVVEAVSREAQPSAEALPRSASVSRLTETSANRIVDANLNRAREALRVVEDYCRFVRNDRTFTEQVKTLRHRLATATATLPTAALLASRDTPGDVGTTVTTSSEYARQSPRQVAVVNLKRLQEALRSVEEYGKLFAPQFAQQVEQIRYETYTLERLLANESPLRAQLDAAKLYILLTFDRCPLGPERTIFEAAAGGARIVQLREKSLTDRELLKRAAAVRRWSRDAGMLFIVNDRPDIARLVDADGVHVGQDDFPAADARRVLGPDRLIGVSTHNLDQVWQAVLDGADYLGVGPTFPSRTKEFEVFPGLSFVREATAATSLPMFALGGIDGRNVEQVAAAGGRRVAVAAAVSGSTDPRQAAAELVAALDLPPQ